MKYLNYLGRCLESCGLLVWVTGVLATGPFEVVAVVLGGPLIV